MPFKGSPVELRGFEPLTSTVRCLRSAPRKFWTFVTTTLSMLQGCCAQLEVDCPLDVAVSYL